jgi:hypothetical protein
LLGTYENFPVTPHAKAILTYLSTTETLQQAILTAFSQLNNQEYSQNTIASTTINCKIGFEFGMAEGATFNYLSPEETVRFQKNLRKTALACLDFFCVVKYYLPSPEGKRRPLKFDYYLFRFVFRKPSIILTVFHERGTRHLSIPELIEFLTKQINTELEKTTSKPLKLRTIMCPVPIEKL